MLICVIPLYIAQQLVNTIRIGRCARWGGEGEREGEDGSEKRRGGGGEEEEESGRRRVGRGEG